MISHNVTQGSEAWFEQRLGRVTASRLVDVLAKVKSGEAAARANYRAELVAERLTGKAAESFTNAAMKWGTDCEPLARAAYEALRQNGRLPATLEIIQGHAWKAAPKTTEDGRSIVRFQPRPATR